MWRVVDLMSSFDNRKSGCLSFVTCAGCLLAKDEEIDWTSRLSCVFLCEVFFLSFWLKCSFKFLSPVHSDLNFHHLRKLPRFSVHAHAHNHIEKMSLMAHLTKNRKSSSSLFNPFTTQCFEMWIIKKYFVWIVNTPPTFTCRHDLKQWSLRLDGFK